MKKASDWVNGWSFGGDTKTEIIALVEEIQNDAISYIKAELALERDYSANIRANLEAEKSITDKLRRMVDLAQNANGDKSEREIAASASFMEAMAYTALEAAEQELAKRKEQLDAMKASCVDKCGHPAEFVCEYEDGTRHCLHCECNKLWPLEKELSNIDEILARHPSLANEPNRCAKIEKAINVAIEQTSRNECSAVRAKLGRPKIVCICGSSRFADWAAVHSWNFSKMGYIVLSYELLPQWYWEATNKVGNGHAAEQEGVSHILDELHLRKIDMADEVFVVNKDGYIGKRTAIEVKHARSLGKPVNYMETVK